MTTAPNGQTPALADSGEFESAATPTQKKHTKRPAQDKPQTAFERHIESVLAYERAIIGAALAEPDIAQQIIDAGITPGDFFDPKHSAVMAALMRTKTRSMAETAEQLRADSRDDDARYLNLFIDSACFAHEVQHFIGKIREATQKRELQRLAMEINEGAMEGEPAFIIQAAKNRLDRIESGTTRKGYLPTSEIVSSWLGAELAPPDPVLCDAFDIATKAVIVGPSKARKSFFMLQMLLSVAAGRPDFLGWKITKPRRVLMLNPEIPESHYQSRIRRMLRALHMDPAELADRFTVINCRGVEPSGAMFTEIVKRVEKGAIQIFAADPVYKLIPGDESDQREVKSLLRMLDGIANAGCAVVYSHHTTKGISGDKQVIDRAAGSGVLARDFDWMASIAHHQTHRETGSLVVEQIARSYPPRDAFCIRWEDSGCFVMDDREPIVLTTWNADRTGKAGPVRTAEDALEVITQSGATYAGLFHDALRKRGFTERGARTATEQLLSDGRLARHSFGYPRKTIIGTPTQIAAKQQTGGKND